MAAGPPPPEARTPTEAPRSWRRAPEPRASSLDADLPADVRLAAVLPGDGDRQRMDSRLELRKGKPEAGLVGARHVRILLSDSGKGLAERDGGSRARVRRDGHRCDPRVVERPAVCPASRSEERRVGKECRS